MNKDDILYDFLTRTTYQVPSSKQMMARVYRNRIGVVIAAAILLYGKVFNVVGTLAFAIITLIFMEFVFRKSFLKDLNPIDHKYVSKKTLDIKALIMNAGLYTIIGVMMLYMSRKPDISPLRFWILALVGAGAIGAAITYLFKIIETKGQENSK